MEKTLYTECLGKCDCSSFVSDGEEICREKTYKTPTKYFYVGLCLLLIGVVCSGILCALFCVIICKCQDNEIVGAPHPRPEEPGGIPNLTTFQNPDTQTPSLNHTHDHASQTATTVQQTSTEQITIEMECASGLIN